MVYDIDLRKTKGRSSIGVTFTLGGLIFLVIMGSAMHSLYNEKDSLDSEVKAYDVIWNEYENDEGQTMYSPNYYYQVNGESYICKSSGSSSSKRGNGIVYYNSSNPSECMPDYESSTSYFFLIFLAFPLISIIIGVLQIKTMILKTKIAKNLAYNGVLVKGIPYQLVKSGIEVNDVPLMCISTVYSFPDGKTREIRSEPLKTRFLTDDDRLCDLLYDPNNYDNYFVDFEIKTTGVGSPNIIYYNQSNSNSSSNTYNYDPNTGHYEQTNEYSLNNKF